MNNKCVQCGYCCSVRPCSYGEFDENGKCVYLEVKDSELGTYNCLIQPRIASDESKSEYPMFGCGCSSSLFNTVRDAVIEKINERSRKNSKQSTNS